MEKNQEKKNPTDFALWKLTPTGVRRQMEWDSPWGKGFPGWHIECTAMGVKYLGRQIDIHTGGMDHIPVHHTNEIAQSEGAFGADVVRFWLHNEFVMVDGEKMSKSKGNFYTLDDIVKRGLNPLAVRYFFLQAHYRTPMNFTWEGVEAGQSGYDRLLDKIGELQAKTKNLKIKTKNHNLKLKTEKAQELSKAFLVAINDDLNTAKGLAILWDLLRDQKITDEDKLALALDFDQVLGLKLDQVKAPAAVEIPAEVQRLVSAREQARQNKDFARSDDLRLQIQAAGFEVKDTPAGQVVREA
ncbi:MAG: Cysteine-tRNA ligase [Parcubacteria group bacterium GW2011_GWC2_44_22]|nr:MAG: Cysteine-tRNA ligase [Parcubacteria group bacterium GW2011_GWC2_44_22]